MRHRKKKLVKMLTQNKLISPNPAPASNGQKVKSSDLEILKQIVDDVSDIENTRSDNEINELLQKKDRSVSLRGASVRERSSGKGNSKDRSMSLKGNANSVKDGVLKDRSMSLRDRSMSLKTKTRYEDGECVKYESVVSLDSDSSKLHPDSEKRKEKVKKTIDEVRVKNIFLM